MNEYSYASRTADNDGTPPKTSISNRLVTWCTYGLVTFPVLDNGLRNLPHLHPLGSIWAEVDLLVLAIIAAIRYFQGYRPQWFMWKRMGAWYMLFAIGLTIVGLVKPTIAIEGLRFDIYNLLYVYLLPYVVEPKDVEKFLHVGASIAILIAIDGIYQYITKAPMPASWVDAGNPVRTRVYSVMESPNELADYMALMSPIVLGLCIYTKDKLRKWVYGIGSFFCLVTLVLTYTRSAWIGLFLAALIVSLIFERRLFFIIVVVAIAGFFLPPIHHRITDLFSQTYAIKASAGGRIERWMTAFGIMSTNPLIGQGIGTYGGAVAANYGVQYADGYYFKLLGESGLVGMTLFLGLQFSIIRDLIKYSRPILKGRVRYLYLGAFIGLIAVVIHNGTEDVFEYAPSAVSYYVMGSLFFIWVKAHMKPKENTDELRESA